MAVISFFWNTNMAAVKSCENALYEVTVVLALATVIVRFCDKYLTIIL